MKAEAEALAAISEISYKKAKLAETKIAQEAYQKQQKDKKPEINLERQTAGQRTPYPNADA